MMLMLGLACTSAQVQMAAPEPEPSDASAAAGATAAGSVPILCDQACSQPEWESEGLRIGVPWATLRQNRLDGRTHYTQDEIQRIRDLAARPPSLAVGLSCPVGMGAEPLPQGE